ncbi:MAG TPA: endo-1,4-beta-xylanase [Lacunisphaera sp.]|nr:endo-1,4-beta-xylanase [Lacunisphaera sp.]
MPAPFRTPLLACLLAPLLLPSAARAQLAAGQDKFLGNIVANSVPANFNTYWNQVTPENSGKWGSVEGTRNTMNWTSLDAAYSHAKANGFKFKTHTLVWGAQYPAWITTLSDTEQRAEIEEWMTLLAARYPDLWAVDVVNEPVKTPLPFKNALGGDGATGWDWVIKSFELARAKFPNAKLLINEYGTENDAAARNQMLAIINLLKDRGLIDGIGIQAHAFNLDGMTAAQMTTCLDAYAATGLDLYITELDIRGTGSTHTESAQAAKYQELFPVMWAHPAVKGVTLWGYVSGQTWLADTGILNSDGSERAAMTWLKAYLSDPTAPAAPSNLTATVSSSSQINLAWTDNATTETAYKVERATSSSGPWTEIAGTLAANSTTYAATGLSASTTYYFRVRAGAGATSNSPFSATASATTSAPPAPPPPPPPSSGGGGGGGGGGGSPSLWFIGFLSLAALLRLRRPRV